MRLTHRCFASLLLASCLGGCVSVSSKVDPYPAEWVPAESPQGHECPTIAGRYANAGAVTVKLAGYCDGLKRYGYPRANTWSCDRRLSTNLVGEDAPVSRAHAANWIEVEQSDADTLQISVPDDASIKPWLLKRSKGDFQCAGSTLAISTAGSSFNRRGGQTNPLITGLVLTTLSGGIASSELKFRPLKDGALTMEVNDTDIGTHFLVAPYASKGNGFVRWEPYSAAAPVIGARTE